MPPRKGRKIGTRKRQSFTRGHRRRKPSGGWTWVNPYYSNRNKNIYSLPPLKPIIVRSTYVKKSNIVKKGLDVLKLAFPEYKSLLNMTKFLFDNKNEINDSINMMLSNSSVEDKLDYIYAQYIKPEISYNKDLVLKKISYEFATLINNNIDFKQILLNLSPNFAYVNENILTEFMMDGFNYGFKQLLSDEK